MILSAVLMLRYLGLFDQAAAIEHAVFVTLESGVLTGDVVGYDRGTPTSAYTDAIIGNLGKRTETWTIREPSRSSCPCSGRRARLRAARVAQRRRPRRVRRVPAVRRASSAPP